MKNDENIDLERRKKEENPSCSVLQTYDSSFDLHFRIICFPSGCLIRQWTEYYAVAQTEVVGSLRRLHPELFTKRCSPQGRTGQRSLLRIDDLLFSSCTFQMRPAILDAQSTLSPQIRVTMKPYALHTARIWFGIATYLSRVNLTNKIRQTTEEPRAFCFIPHFGENAGCEIVCWTSLTVAI